MNKIIYEYNDFRIKVRDVIIVLVILFLLFFILKGCEKDEGDILGTQINFADNICEISKRNIESIEELLEHADLCDDEWLEQLAEHIQVLEEQNKGLALEYELDDFYQLQVKVVELLKAFKENQNEKTIEDLRPIIKNYRNFYDDRCITGLE